MGITWNHRVLHFHVKTDVIIKIEKAIKSNTEKLLVKPTEIIKIQKYVTRL